MVAIVTNNLKQNKIKTQNCIAEWLPVFFFLQFEFEYFIIKDIQLL